jgi:uncharacterized membrane protein YozB (DUF420 family)
MLIFFGESTSDVLFSKLILHILLFIITIPLSLLDIQAGKEYKAPLICKKKTHITAAAIVSGVTFVGRTVIRV